MGHRDILLSLNSGVYFLAIVNPPSIYIVLQKIDSQKLCPLFMLTAVTDKTTQNKKDTREVSRIFYSAIAPFNGTKRFEFLL